MKKSFLALALLASINAIPTFAGTETSGGGDAIYVNDELILRDFFKQSQFKTITNNADFLRSIPDLKELLSEIATAYPLLALNILADLSSTSIFIANDQLQLLPASRTTFTGPTADVQIAVRSSDNIILFPKYKQLKDISYLMVHEALHGLIKSTNYNAIHHHKVRGLVNYLKENRGNYNAKELALIFEKNGYSSRNYIPSKIMASNLGQIFNETLAEEIRCYLLASSDQSYAFDVAAEYFQLNCKQSHFSDVNDDMELYLDKIVSADSEDTKRYHQWKISEAYYEDLKASSKYEFINRFELPKLNIFQTEKKQYQIFDCKLNNQYLDHIESNSRQLIAALDELQAVQTAVDNQTINEKSLKLILNYLLPYSDITLTDAIEKIRVELDVHNLTKETALKNKNLCVERYPKKFN